MTPAKTAAKDFLAQRRIAGVVPKEVWSGARSPHTPTLAANDWRAHATAHDSR